MADLLVVAVSLAAAPDWLACALTAGAAVAAAALWWAER